MWNNETMRVALEQAAAAAAALHAMPEAAFHEYRTTAYLRAACEACGAEILDLGMETGVAAWLDCGCGDTVALRADIDAVPTDGAPAHRCGHDYHAATLLGAMHYLCANRAALPHNVLFLYQPAEECTQGMAAMLRSGLLEKVPQRPSRLFGIHNRPELPVGVVGVHPGELMAEKTNFTLCLTGKVGHGGSPQCCIDPVVAAAAFVMGVQTIVSRNVDPLEAAVCSVCSIRSGTEDDFPSAASTMSGSIRTFRHDVHLRVMERMEQLAAHTAAGYECTSSLRWIPEVPAVCNGPEMTEIARRAAEKTVGAARVTDPRPCLASEDFAVLGSRIPSFFYWVGSGRPDGTSAAWHTPDFCVADGYLDVAVPLLIRAALEP